jgi:hypothetical protein
MASCEVRLLGGHELLQARRRDGKAFYDPSLHGMTITYCACVAAIDEMSSLRVRVGVRLTTTHAAIHFPIVAISFETYSLRWL